MARHSQRQMQKLRETKTIAGPKPATMPATRSKQATKQAQATANAQEQVVVTETSSKTLQKESVVKMTQVAVAAPTFSTSVPMISLKQSLDLTKILLYSSISTIAYLRNWFPEYCFRDQVFYLDPHHLTYHQFSTGASGVTSVSRKQNSYRCLLRGRKSEADKFLNIIEKGLFDAVEKQALRAFRIDVTDTSYGNACVMESYIFTLRYARNTDGSKVFHDLEILGPQRKSGQPNKTVPGIHNIKLEMDMGIRRAVEICKTLPALPMKLGLDVTTYYTEDSDPTYWGPGFSKSNQSCIYFAQSEEWEKTTSHCGVTDMSHYAASLKIQHLEANPSAAYPNIVPLDLRYDVATQGEDDVDDSIDYDLALKHAALLRGPEEQHMTNIPVAQSLADLEQLNLDEGIGRRPVSNLDVTETQESTQAKLNQSRLHNMLRQSPDNHSAEDTQVVAPHSAQNKMQDFVAQFARLQLSSAKLAELKSHRRNTATGPSRSRSKRGIIRYDEETVACQCGHTEEDGNMIQCDFCDSWQHSICYGYIDEVDPRLPDIHACYKCLLEEKESHLLETLSRLTLLRKGTSIAINFGYNRDSELSKQMNCSLKTVAEVVRHLKTMRWLVPNQANQKRDSLERGQPKFVVTVDDEDHSGMMKELFDPTLHILHHFELSYILSDTARTTQWAMPPQDTEMSDTLGLTSVCHDAPDSDLMTTSPSRGHSKSLRTRAPQPASRESWRESTNHRTSTSACLTDIEPNITPHRTSMKKRNLEEEDDSTTPIAKRVRVGGRTSPEILIGHSPSPYP